jgi:hypothetical protein
MHEGCEVSSSRLLSLVSCLFNDLFQYHRLYSNELYSDQVLYGNEDTVARLRYWSD